MMKRTKVDSVTISQFKAILYRRLITVKRSYKNVLISAVGTVVFSALGIAIYYLIVMLMSSDPNEVTFNSYSLMDDVIVLVKSTFNPGGSTSDSSNVYALEPQLKSIFQEDMGYEPTVIYYDDIDTCNEEFYKNSSAKIEGFTYIPFGFWMNGTESDPRPTVLYNSTSYGDETAQFIYYRALFKNYTNGGDISISTVQLYLQIQQLVYSQIGPILIASGLLTIIPLLISSPITDINGEVRPYMESCTLTLFPYWLAYFVVDFAVWCVVVIVLWAIFSASLVASVTDNLFNTIYALVMSGPSFILFVYCVSFWFSNSESASRQAFFIMSLILLIPMIVDIIRGFDLSGSSPWYLSLIYAFIPHINLQRILTAFFLKISYNKQGLDYYWKATNSAISLSFQFVDIVIYGSVLWLIERTRKRLQAKSAQKTFTDYSDFFRKAKQKHPVTPEAHEMEEKVHNPSNRWAVKINNVSRLFFNTAGQPIPAVNCVSLGVKKGSLFGFLGANGAGKTTLIKMITSMLPPSDGTIEINGKDISVENDPTVLSICPQFNTHLCKELTPAEHFRVYSLLFRLSPSEEQQATDKLLGILQLQDKKDVPIRELSDGDVRKLAIALCFLGPAKIILLDEPTASLDPVARHRVHEMISEFKGEKTFMLCTHLLSEAETLCDTISIMIKGNVYTVGSPGELSAKFGTEYKIDVQFEATAEAADVVTKWFQKNIPTAKATIMRPTARIYAVPAADTNLPNLFKVMQHGKEQGIFTYYTCSTSSLERVFMEIVHMSEQNDEAHHVVEDDYAAKERTSSVDSVSL